MSKPTFPQLEYDPKLLVQRWQNQVEKRLFINRLDWQHSVNLALIECILRDDPLDSVLQRFSMVRGKSGFSLEEIIADLQCLAETLPGDIRPRLDRLNSIRSLEMQTSRFIDMEKITECTDELTQLPKEAYVRARIRELYRQGRALGVTVTESYTIVVVDLKNRHLSHDLSKTWNASIANSLKRYFDRGETVAVLHSGLFIILAENTTTLPESLVTLREILDTLFKEKNVVSDFDLTSYYPHIWQESFGETPQSTFQILNDLIAS